MHTLQLNTRITLQKPTTARGNSGGFRVAWTPHLTCWAQRRDMSGGERGASSAAGGLAAQARVEFVLRERAGITAHMRVLHQGETLNIIHVKPLADFPGWMVLTCDTGHHDG